MRLINKLQCVDYKSRENGPLKSPVRKRGFRRVCGVRSQGEPEMRAASSRARATFIVQLLLLAWMGEFQRCICTVIRFLVSMDQRAMRKEYQIQAAVL